jgi:DNA (cytosine-5)-methyltransferase 1
VVRCLDALRPTWFLGENVHGIINMALDQVCTDLEGLGYTVWPVCLPACAVDAPHQRQRIWIVAHAERQGPQGYRGECGLGKGGEEVEACRSGNVADAILQQWDRGMQWSSWWAREPLDPLQDARRRMQEEGLSIPESLLGRVAYGVPDRVDRLKGLGNAIVPQIAEALGRMILEADYERTSIEPI